MTEPDIVTVESGKSGASGLRLVLWLLVGLAAITGVAIAFGRQQPAEHSTQIDLGGPIKLTASNGSPYSEQNLAGKPFAIFFGFTRCPDVCPTTLARMARLRQALGKDGDKFAIVFVSVDAGRDKPAQVGAYTQLFGTPIVGLTGTEAQIAAITKEYRVFFEKVPIAGGDYTIDHTASVFLMGPDGHFQSIIDHDENDQSALAKLRRLIA